MTELYGKWYVESRSGGWKNVSCVINYVTAKLTCANFEPSSSISLL